MTNGFKKLMMEQLQERLSLFSVLADNPNPKNGWIRTIRDALGISGDFLAKKLNCSRVNITALEQRECNGKITLNSLEQVAQALNCKLVYCLIPNEPLNKILEKQARIVAKKRILAINHSMKLEEQGLTSKQLQQQENDLVQELLQGNSNKLWGKDEV